jgi:hypothetical protein
LCLFHVLLALLHGVFHAFGDLSSLLDIKLVLRFRLRNRPIERGSRKSTVKELVRRHANRAMRERKLNVIDYRQILILVVLVIHDIQAQSLIDILIHDFCLVIRLRVVCRK